MANSGFYSIIVPVQKRNEATNPSGEIGTAGWGTLQGGTVGTTSAVQAYGAWCGSVAPSNNGTSGFLGPAFTASNGSAYSYSFYGSFPVGSVYRIGIGDTNGASLQGSFLGTGGGTWYRYVGSFTESAGASRRLAIRKNSNAATDAFYIDAIQYELGSVTTYIDGDQEGCQWDGAPQASTSLRSGTARMGGTVYNLNDLGMTVLEHGGIGMPDVTNVMQDYGILPGAYYQTTRANVRAMVLTGLYSGTTWQGLQAIRQQIIDVMRPDLTPQPQPFRLIYTGAGGSTTIDVTYDSGLQFGERDGFAEITPVRMVAAQPFYSSLLDRGTTLSPMRAMGSTNYLVYRDGNLQWGTFGVAGTTIASTVAAASERIEGLETTPGTLWVGGFFDRAGGTFATNIAYYTAAGWGTLTGGSLTTSGGTTSNIVNSILVSSTGTITAAGLFTNAGGTTCGNIAQWSGAWGTFAGGTINDRIESVLQFGGTLFVNGRFTQAGGTTSRYTAFHNGVNWGTLTGGSIGSVTNPRTITMDGAGTLIALQTGAAAGGTANANAIAAWSGAWGTLGDGLRRNAGLAVASGIAVDQRGIIYVAGQIGTAGGIRALNAASWNRSGWSALSSGIGTDDSTDITRAVFASPFNGLVYYAGQFNSVGGVPMRNLTAWNGGAFVSPGIVMPGGVSNIASVLDESYDGTLYVGGQFSGTSYCAVTATIANDSGANTAPRLVLRAPSSGTVRVHQFINATTNQAIFFNLVLAAGEQVTLDLTQTQTSLTSTLRGNLIGAVLPGSNLSQWVLQKGTNFVSFFADNASLRADVVYRPRFWSADTNEV